MRKTLAAAMILVAALALFGLLGCSNKPGATDAVQAASRQPSLAQRLFKKPSVDIPAGTELRVRLNQSLDTSSNRAGDTFTATLDSPVMAGEKVVIPKGTQFTGHVVSAQLSGRLKGRGYLSVELDSFEMNGQTHRLETSASSRATGAHKKRNLVLIGGGSGVGALIGGLAGGGTGALIGAGAGAAAGTAGAALTGQKNAVIPAETVLRFTLKEPVQVKG